MYCSAADTINQSLGNDKVTSMELDVAQFAKVRSFAEAFLARDEQLHVLINNAGILHLTALVILLQLSHTQQ